MEPLYPLLAAITKHIGLTADLYARGAIAKNPTRNAGSLNIALTLQSLTPISAEDARYQIREMIWTRETQIAEEYSALVEGFGEDERVMYARRVIMACVGYMYYLATVRPYGMGERQREEEGGEVGEENQ